MDLGLPYANRLKIIEVDRLEEVIASRRENVKTVLMSVSKCAFA